jgi:hypothetical protein
MLRKLEASEAQEQSALVEWMLTQPNLCNYIIKIDNEGKRSPLQGHKAKVMGMHPGASDLFLAVPAGRLHGIWIEMKRKRDYTASEKHSRTWLRQVKFQASMRRNGYEAVTAYGWEHGKKLINDYILYNNHKSEEKE